MDARAATVAHRLEAVFGQIALTRMQDMPLLNAALRVQAVDFEPLPQEPDIALGVLLTPWFMNLVRVPLTTADAAALLPVGVQASHAIGAREISFTGGHDEAFGPYEMCSLFSPVFEFADHDAALATAREVLTLLRQPDAPRAAPPPVPARRGFLFGRGAQGAA